MQASFYAHVAIALLNLGIGGYVLLQNPKSLIHQAFFVLVVGIAGWEVGIVVLSMTENFRWVAPTLLSGELVVFALIVLSEVFPENEYPKPSALFALVPLVALAALTPFNVFITSVRFNARGYLEPENGILFPLFVVVMGCCILFGFWNLFQKYRTARGGGRVQLRYLMAGMGAFVAAAFLFDVALPAFHVFQFNLLGPLFSVFLIGFVGYAIVRYGFLDIEVIIKRSFMYLCVIAAGAGIFFALEFAVERFYYNDEIVDIICAMVGAFAFTWLRSVFEKITDRIFFRKEYDYAESVRELGPLLNSTIDLEALLKIIATFLSKTIKPKSVVFFLAPGAGPVVFAYEKESKGKQFFDAYRIRAAPFFEVTQNMLVVSDGGVAAIVPLRTKDQVSAVMLLEEKLSDDILRPKDIKLLAIVSHQAGMAIDNARLYQAVQRHTETLEDIVDERTKEVKAAYNTRSDFLTDISHQLQTPIAIMQGNLELAERGRGEQARHSLRTIRNTLDGMSQLVAGFLDIARLNFSKNKLHKEQFDVGELVRETYEDCLVLTTTKGVALVCSVHKLMVAGDRRKIKEVLLNLVSNALKHTPRGGRIELGASGRDGYAEVAVRDTGVGISPENLSHIFERFYKIPGTASKGNGLGLNICRQIIELHRGTITAESFVGIGSAFTVHLPLVAEQEPFSSAIL